MVKIKAIFFDADGTLVNHKECEKQALNFLFDNIGISYKDDYQDVFRPIDIMLWENESYNGTPVSRDDIPTYRFKLLFEKKNINYDNYTKANEFFKVGLAKSVALMENAVEIIDYLHNKGYIICVVTNGLIELQRPRLTNSKINKYISHIMVSEEVGAHKPNPLIFNTLLKKICLDHSEVIMVGDSLKNDIQGGKNANIKTVWYNPDHVKNKTGILPDYKINNLLELKDMFWIAWTFSSQTGV